MDHYSNTYEVNRECRIQKKIALPFSVMNYFPLVKFLTDHVGTIIR